MNNLKLCSTSFKKKTKKRKEKENPKILSTCRQLTLIFQTCFLKQSPSLPESDINITNIVFICVRVLGKCYWTFNVITNYLHLSVCYMILALAGSLQFLYMSKGCGYLCTILCRIVEVLVGCVHLWQNKAFVFLSIVPCKSSLSVLPLFQAGFLWCVRLFSIFSNEQLGGRKKNTRPFIEITSTLLAFLHQSFHNFHKLLHYLNFESYRSLHHVQFLSIFCNKLFESNLISDLSAFT